MKIAGREIGPGHEPYVIAEIGVNHDGDAALALSLVESAAAAGADAVKFQYFETDRLLSSAAKLAAYQEHAGETDAAAMLRRLELNDNELRTLVERAHALGVHAIASVFSVELVERARAMGWDAFKTASPDVVNKPLLDALEVTGRPLIVSTGTATIGEVRRCAHWLRRASDVAFLHCVSAYPTPPEHASIGAMGDIARVTCRPVGYSDHTTREDAGMIAVAAGACLLEKHVSYDRDAAGPDHASSLDPEGFLRYVQQARLARAMLGERFKSPGVNERDVKSVSRQSLVAVRTIGAGEAITREALTVKRPGTGIEPWRLDAVIGTRAVRPIAADMPLVPDDLERRSA